jgi:type 1 fimbria pilin
MRFLLPTKEFNMNIKIIPVQIALLIFISSFSFAANTNAIEHKTAPSGVVYVEGGISDEQSQQFETLKNQFNTRFTFAEHGSGAYLAGIKVVIENSANQTVLNTLVPGPFLYAKLPVGHYIANVTDENQTQRFKFKISAGQKIVHVFYFKQP